MKNSILYYSVGALLYCPANKESIVSSLTREAFGRQFSLALCLEDTINASCVASAEETLVHTIKDLFASSRSSSFYLPEIFIRVRKPEQIPDLMERFGCSGALITGFIIPKFSPDNANDYIDAMVSVNRTSDHTLYMMPIFESPSLIHLQKRYPILYTLKEKLDRIEELVLNIRVGGNDLCHAFGFRRQCDESIHSITPVFNILSDIITVFGMDYVISGPVWEYYSGEGWDTGLKRELKEDRLCGFTGKTVIHPNQIPLVNEAYQVTQKDLDDARAILNWDAASPSLVLGNSSGERMNEYKTHFNWAMRILMLSEVFGVK